MLTPNVIDRVGASTSRRGSGRGSPGSVSVSPMVTSGRPATETISPGPASAMSIRSMPCAVWRLVTDPENVIIRPGSISPAVSSASSRTTAIRWPTRMVPFRIRPTAMRPTYSLADRLVTRSWSGCSGSNTGRRRDADEQLEQRVEVGAGHGQVAGRRAQLRVRVHDRELDLVLVGAEVHEQLVDVVEDLRRAGVGAVDLVERDDDGQPARHRLLQDVAGLRERALGRVDQQQHAVDHEQAALDLAAEVRVPWGVDDVQADAVDVDRRLLGEDRDALLALEVARVHDAVDHGLVRAEGAGLAEHRVDEGGLAVVDVGDDRDVAEVVADGGGGVRRGGGGHGGAGGVVHGPAKCRTCRRFGRTRRVAAPSPAGRPRPAAGGSVR